MLWCDHSGRPFRFNITGKQLQNGTKGKIRIAETSTGTAVALSGQQSAVAYHGTMDESLCQGRLATPGIAGDDHGPPLAVQDLGEKAV